MCYSMLRITFKNDPGNETKECASESDERTKIAEARDKPQVAKIAVFRCQRHITRDEVWRETPYSPPEVDTLVTGKRPEAAG